MPLSAGKMEDFWLKDLPKFSKFSSVALKNEEILLSGLPKFSKFLPAALKKEDLCVYRRISMDLGGF